jgi:catechol 2,3-dioxygenase-like lactoylglutathione lyase family enzyme
MELGAFSVSLAVRDLEASRSFYEALGFSVMGGDAQQGWLILHNASAVIGLFQGMFERNLLTFNPGWDADAQPIDDFTDVRELQRRLKAAGIAIEQESDEASAPVPVSSLMTPANCADVVAANCANVSVTNAAPASTVTSTVFSPSPRVAVTPPTKSTTEASGPPKGTPAALNWMKFGKSCGATGGKFAVAGVMLKVMFTFR